MKCKKAVKMADPKVKTTSNGRKMVQGKCPHCGTTVTKFVSDDVAKKFSGGEDEDYSGGKRSGRKSGRKSGKKSGGKRSGKRSGKRAAKK